MAARDARHEIRHCVPDAFGEDIFPKRRCMLRDNAICGRAVHPIFTDYQLDC